MSRALVLAFVLWQSLGGGAGAAERYVVLISIDGLRPAFYLDHAYRAPNLRALLKAGAHARAAEPVFPSVTYPGHASIVTGVRPVRHGIAFNVRFDPAETRLRWYADATDLRATPIWDWARAARLSTAALSWPSTVGAPIDALVPEQDYYGRTEPLDLLLRSSTPGLFERVGVRPRADMFKDVTKWDGFLTETAAAIIRRDRPRLLLLHLIETDYRQHRDGPDGGAVKAALGRIDAHIGTVLQALRDAGIAERTAVIVTGDHGFARFSALVFPNAVLARAGLRPCPGTENAWRATVHVAGAAAALFVNPPGDVEAIGEADAALRAEAPGRYTIVTREQLDRLGAMPNAAALALEAAPGYGMSGACDRGVTAPSRGGTHGFLPSRPDMATGFIAAGDGVRGGGALARIRLIDIAPTAARLLGVTPPPVEGRALEEILR